MVFSIITIAASFVISVVFVALILHVSHKMTWYDRKSERKIHIGDIPRLGGAGFAAAFIIVAIVITLRNNEFSPGLRFLFPLTGLTIVTVLGVSDDFRGLRPGLKFFVHCLSALLVIIPGYVFTRPFFSYLGMPARLGWLMYPLSFIWVIGMVNAVNFIDGVDGLAGGVSFFIAMSYAGVFILLPGLHAGTIICICLAAVLLGFLVFNAPFPRARIFMGDGGAYFIGFVLALLPLTVRNEATANTPPMFYIGALVLIPVFDAAAAIWRRVRDGKRISEPDKLHVHHKLINLGLSPRQVTLTLCALQITLGCFVLVSVRTRAKPALSLSLLAAAYIICLGFFSAVHFMNRRVLKYGEAGPARTT